MDPEAPDAERVLGDLRNCLNTFDAWADSFFSGSALKVEQVFKVGDDVALVAPISSDTQVTDFPPVQCRSRTPTPTRPTAQPLPLR
ncbi:hypothetical protein, partial [Pseudomonas fluorescens]|uniref:hypothetical protein n=1 Tax=Pseudomonas fluorescens TaxID=294 RepID=UPI003B3A015B